MSLPKTENAKVEVATAISDMEGHDKATPESHGFLSAPLTGPIRPFSPDALSMLSTDEYGQIQQDLQSHFDTDERGSSHIGSQGGWRLQIRVFWTRNYGLFLMLLAQLFGTMMNTCTRLLEVEGNKGKGLHPFQILFARMSITFVLATLYMYHRQTPHFPFGLPEVRLLLIARSFGGIFGVVGMYYSLLYLPLADATVITFLAPGLACWACSYLIKEPFTRVEKIGTSISLVGVLFIARPVTLFQAFGNAPPASSTGEVDSSDNNTGVPVGNNPDAGNYDNVTPAQRLTAVGIALVGVFGAASAYTTIRWIGNRAHPLISVNYFAIWCTFVSLVMMFALPDVGFLLPADGKEWGYLFLLGVTGFIMQFLLAASLSYEKSSRATNIVYCQMLFAIGFDKLIFGHLPGVPSIIGSSLILGAAIIVAMQKNNTSTIQVTAEGSSLLVDEEAAQGPNSQSRSENDTIQDIQMTTLR